MAKAKKKATKKTATKKAATKKATAKKAPAKKAKGAKRKPNAAFMKKLTVSDALAAVIGAVSRAHGSRQRALEIHQKARPSRSEEPRNILADDKLKSRFRRQRRREYVRND